MLMTPEMPPTMRRAPEREEASFIVRAGLLLAMRHHSLAVSHTAFSFSVALIEAVRLVLPRAKPWASPARARGVCGFSASWVQGSRTGGTWVYLSSDVGVATEEL